MAKNEDVQNSAQRRRVQHAHQIARLRAISLDTLLTQLLAASHSERIAFASIHMQSTQLLITAAKRGTRMAVTVREEHGRCYMVQALQAAVKTISFAVWHTVEGRATNPPLHHSRGCDKQTTYQHSALQLGLYLRTAARAPPR